MCASGAQRRFLAEAIGGGCVHARLGDSLAAIFEPGQGKLEFRAELAGLARRLRQRGDCAGGRLSRAFTSAQWSNAAMSLRSVSSTGV